ncbi:hypothetical protein MOC76_16260 [Bacillus spizizenii]|uniref:hypothetical protein n=1 Tax=Bacillus spizizenii TaxID=96241 RepID=UPI00227F7291|nr:hypothetical protein [Bacillus spizizenii]MCY8063846.1 hypothetical protein [Bacillus spizizenii]MCY8135316.1 hypothetical protein [Bacillus spizizenii]MCY8256892.1 hypothetical protein [Bacillus spizizenii]MCY8335361.1 hypothetical protein [Bacillus spizizenii]MCY9443521.1 hypothetical protein [Bacillus spizizenii]
MYCFGLHLGMVDASSLPLNNALVSFDAYYAVNKIFPGERGFEITYPRKISEMVLGA